MEDKPEDSKLFSISIDPEENTKFDKILYNREISIVPKDETEEVKNAGHSFGKCWNCNGDHAIRDCKEKINQIEVSRKRKLMLLQKGRFGSMFKRYHLELEELYPNFTPGVISPKLRTALGLSQYQLPKFIYNMRSIGYPPGWLEEAKSGPSGINMLDSNGDRVPNRDEEEGEIFVEKCVYDLSKIVSYPGYNVWPNAAMLNETDKYGALPMCREHSKEFFIEKLKEIMEGDGTEGEMNKSLEDMETTVIEDVPIDTTEKFSFIPPIPDDPNSPPPPPPEDTSDEEEGEINTKKIKKRRISKKVEKIENKLDETWSSDNSFVESHGKSVSIELGTPALKIHSPFTKLPSFEAFRRNISDVEFFDNLPNSTGKYEQLKTVLSSVRSKLNSLRGKN